MTGQSELVVEFDEFPGEYRLRLRGVAMEDYFSLIEADEAYRGADGVAILGAVRELFRLAGDAGIVVAWPHPEAPDAAGWSRIDVKLGLALIAQWLMEVGRVPRPLPLSASGGTPSTSEADPQPSSSPSS